MHIVHLALGGCFKAPPVQYGLTADTGGHIAYILDAAIHQAAAEAGIAVTIVTRRFDDSTLGPDYLKPSEPIAPGVTLLRLATTDARYLEKEALAGEVDVFADAMTAWLDGLAALPDVIHAHFADAAKVAAVVKRRFGIPFVYTPHSLGLDKARSGLVSLALERRIEAEHAAIAQSNAIIVSTDEEATRQVGGYGVAVTGRVHCVAPGVPDRRCGGNGTSAITAQLDAALTHPERPIILAVARPVRKKNLTALLAAYASSAVLRDCANLVVVAGQHANADAEEAGVLAELRAAMGRPEMAGRVFLPERHEPADVEALFARAAAGGVFVNPAWHEPFGLTLIEAAAAGVPVVATRNGGPSEIIASLRNGRLIDPADPAAIAEACLSIVSDRERHEALATAGKTNVARYSWQTYAQRSLAIYRALDRVLYRALGRPALLASDIDNTLTGCATSARAFAAWSDTRSLGFVVATGRRFEEALRVLRRWDVPMPDAFIVDVGTRIMLPAGHGTWRQDPDYAATIGAGWDREAVAIALAAFDDARQPAECQSQFKLSFFGDRHIAHAIEASLEERGLAARVIFSHGRLIDVIPAKAGKLAAIAAYATARGIPLSACIAAGDSGNDEDMLTGCGHAIVVGNADADLDDLPARPTLYRATGHHAAGVLEGLKQLGLQRGPDAISDPIPDPLPAAA